MNQINLTISCCKVNKFLRHFGYQRLKKYFAVVDAEDTTVTDFATFAGGKQLDVAPTSVKFVSQGDTISEFEYFAVGFPYGNIHRVTAVKHSASGGNVYCF